MKPFLELVMRQLLDEPTRIVLQEEAAGSSREFLLLLPASEVGKIVGKQGHTIQAIRSLLTGASRSGERIRFEVEEQESL